MPTPTFGAAHGRKQCPDPTCQGHTPREMSGELWTHAWTRRIGTRLPEVTRVEHLPVQIPDRHQICEFCGKPNVITNLVSGEPGVGIPRLEWPAPAQLGRNALVDEQLPEPPPPPTLEERVERLEQRLERLEQALGAEAPV